MEYKVFRAPLTAPEKKLLREQQFKNFKSIGLVFGLMFFGILALAEKIPTDVLISLLTLIAIVVGSIVLMILFVFGPATLYRKDIELNSKTVIQGILENKIQEEVNSSGSAGNLGNHYYYFLMGENKVQVPWQQYYGFIIGESIEIHLGTNSKHVLGIERKSPQPEQDYSYRVTIEDLTLSEKSGMVGRTVFVSFIASGFIFGFGYTAYNTYPETWGFFIPTGLLAITITGFILYYIFNITSSIIIGKKEIVEGTLRGKEWRNQGESLLYFGLPKI